MYLKSGYLLHRHGNYEREISCLAEKRVIPVDGLSPGQTRQGRHCRYRSITP